MAINFIKKEDLSHITRTTRQWETTIDRYEIIPKGVLCIELCNDKLTKIKIGNGHLIYEQLPYVSDVNLSDYYTKEETNNLIKNLKSIKIKGEASSLSDLPLRGNEDGDLWFVNKPDPDTHSRYDEYVWYNNKWESGSSDIDLSEYAKKSYVDTHIQEVQNEITEIIESGYLHKHDNKNILDHTSAVYNVEKDNKLRDLHNYDDTELREKAHTHLNKNILDQTDAVYNRDKDDKLELLHNYDDTTVKQRLSSLESVSHSHSNLDVLNRTTAAFTKEQALTLLDCKDFKGTDGVHDGYHGFVPAPTKDDVGKVLGANGQWVEGGGGGSGDTITEGGGISITTDAQTGSKVISVNAGTGLEIDQQTGELYVTSTGGDTIDEGSGIDITTDSQTGVKTISVKIGNHLSFDQTTGDINVDDIVEYTAGDGVTITLVDDVDVFNNGDGWENLCYSNSIGNDTTGNYQWEIHSPISNSLTIPRGATQIKAVAKDTNDNLIWTSFSWIDSNDYHFTSTAPNDGHYDDWFDIPSGSVKVNFGVRWTQLSTSQAISTSDVNSVTVMFDNGNTKRIDVNVGDGLSINQDNELEVSLGNGLQFDSNDAVEVNVGDGLSINASDEVELDKATTSSIGGVIIGDNIDVNNGTISVPKAASNKLGVVKPSDGLSVDSNGVLTVDTGDGLSIDSTTKEVNVNVGRALTINQNNDIDVNIASRSAYGVVKVGEGVNVDSNGIISVEAAPPFRTGDGIILQDESERLPSGFTKIEYVESSSTNVAYTSINYYVNANSKFIGKMSKTELTTNNYGSSPGTVFGTIGAVGNYSRFMLGFVNDQDSSSPLYCGIQCGDGTSPDPWYNNKSSLITAFTLNDIVNFEASVAEGLKLNNELHQTYQVYGGILPVGRKLGVMAADANGIESGSAFYGRLYFLKIYEENVLKVSLVPCIQTSSSTPGLYDTVAGTFYASTSGNPFLYDPETIDVEVPDWVLKADIATSSTLGGVIVGNGLTVTSDGTISTVTGKAYIAGEGINMSSSPNEFSAENEQYLFRSQVTCELHGDFNREFQKTTDDTALGIIWNVYDSGTLWSGPVFVGLSSDAVKYTTNSTTYSALGTFSYLGKTWYYSDTQMYVSNIDGTDYDGNMVVDTGSSVSTSELVDFCKSLIDRARVILKVDEISLLPATEDTLGGIKIGEGLSIDENNVVSSTVYEEGQGITFETTESGEGFSVKNKEYYFTDTVSCQLNGDYGPRTFTRVSTDPCLLAIAQAPSNGTMWSCPLAVGLTENSVKYSNSYDGVTVGPDDSFEYRGYTWYITWNYGMMNSSGVDLMGNVPTIDTTSIDMSDRNDLYLLGQALIDAAELIQTIITMDVWNGGTGWLNGDYYSSDSDTFTTNWYYTYHYDPTEYIPVPEGALKVRVIGISNNNDSHFEGGGVNAFDSNHHHTHWVACCTATDEWVDIPEGVVYVQPEVKWNNDNTLTISAADIKSVTLQFWYSDPRNNAITAKLGNGLGFDQDDAIQVKLGDGLIFDEDNQVAFDESILPSDPTVYAPGDAISFVDNQNPYVTKVRWTVSEIRGGVGDSWIQLRYFGFYDNNQNRIPILSGIGAWEDGSTVSYYQHRTLNNMIANSYEMTASTWTGSNPFIMTFDLPSGTRLKDLKYFRYQTGDDENYRDPVSWTIHAYDEELDRWLLIDTETSATVPTTRNDWTSYFDLAYDSSSPSSSDIPIYDINVKYGDGLTINQNNELTLDTSVQLIIHCVPDPES